MNRKSFIPVFLFLTLSLSLWSQDPERFRAEIDNIEKKYAGIETGGDLIVFTGSSSLRRWENLDKHFPGMNIINTAFGGSQMSDLIFYSELVILKYKPSKVVIYEGDNDIAAKEKADSIAYEAEMLFRKIHQALPRTRIYILSAKPSPVRWKYSQEYLKLNNLYRKLSEKLRYVNFIDVWTPLISASGRPRGELYIKDSLHINDSGYLLWAPVIRKSIR